MAYFVVAIHTTRWSLWGLLDIAVPWFFLVSGFFLFRKMDGNKEEDLFIIKTWIVRIFVLYLIWTLIYLPFAIVPFHNEKMSLGTSVIVWLRNVILVGENLYSCQLWYLLALLWGGILIWVMRLSGLPLWGMFLVGLSLYLGAKFFQLDNTPMYVKLFKTTRNGLFLGLFFLTGGGLIQKWVDVSSIRKPILWDALLIIVSFVCFQLNRFFMFPLCAGIFLLSYRLELVFLDDNIARDIGSMSKIIYLIHMIIVGLMCLYSSIERGLLFFAITSIASTLIALVFIGPLRETRIYRLLFNWR